MKINSMVFILSSVMVMTLADCTLLHGAEGVSDYTGEHILYLITPFGKAEYDDHGVVDLEGRKVNLTTFVTKAFMFEDSERIYSDPESLLPYRIERTISRLWGKEYITEEYDQEKYTVTFKKFKSDKLVSEQISKASGPIHNAILLPFDLRTRTDLAIGWRFTARVPEEFQLELVSIDELTVPAGKFEAYHFKSTPD
ncbi:MAG: hypothetical protein AB1530_07645, partial [Candidatus Omnitrophota bacterium]